MHGMHLRGYEIPLIAPKWLNPHDYTNWDFHILGWNPTLTITRVVGFIFNQRKTNEIAPKISNAPFPYNLTTLFLFGLVSYHHCYHHHQKIKKIGKFFSLFFIVFEFLLGCFLLQKKKKLLLFLLLALLVDVGKK